MRTETRTLKAGDRAPGFHLSAADGRLFSLAEILAKGPALLLWIRGTW